MAEWGGGGKKRGGATRADHHLHRGNRLGAPPGGGEGQGKGGDATERGTLTGRGEVVPPTDTGQWLATPRYPGLQCRRRLRRRTAGQETAVAGATQRLQCVHLHMGRQRRQRNCGMTLGKCAFY